MMIKEIVYFYLVYIVCVLVLVYFCFLLLVVGLFFFVGFVCYGELLMIVVFSGLIFNVLVGFGVLWLVCYVYNWVVECFGGIEILLCDVLEEV